MQTSSFEHLIKEKFAGLSVAQKKVAEYLLHNMERASFSTAVQIGREVDVSETTVIRLSYALGFSGFSEMQGLIRAQFLHNTNSANGLQQEDGVGPEYLHPFQQVMEKDIAIMRQTLANLDIENIWRAVAELIKADQVLIIGHRGSYAPAYWFSGMLNMMRENVHVNQINVDMYEALYQLTPQSVVVVVSFPRYYSQTLQMAEHAKKLGAKLISVTDRVLSPVGQISDIALLTDVHVDQETGTVSMTSVFSLLSTVLSGIKIRDRERVQARQLSLEQFYANFQVFIE